MCQNSFDVAGSVWVEEVLQRNDEVGGSIV